MKDRLEEFIGKHQQEFDIYEPSDELWEKIEKNLDSSKKWRIGFYLSRIAGVAAIFILSLMVQRYLLNSDNGSYEIPELKEAEMYYNGLINSKLEEVKPLLVNHPQVKLDLETDLSELDSIYNDLRLDLKDNVANQEVIEAMIDNYRIRIQILEEMMQFLKEFENGDNNNTMEYEL